MSNKKIGKLYRHFDKDDNLLYVGISFSLLERTKHHSSYSFWYDRVTKITIESFNSKEAVLAAEKKAIKKEKPKFNIQHGKAENLTVRKKTLTITELSVFLKLCTRTIYRMIEDGRFPVEPIKGTKPRLWRKTEVDKWLRA